MYKGYKGVFVDGKISNPKTGRTLDLRIIGDGEGERLPYIQGVEIKTGHNVDMEMAVTLTPPYEKALELMSQDQEWFRLGNTLALRWGYSDVDGAISDWHMGLMMLPDPDFGEEISVRIPAVGYGFNAGRLARVRSWSTLKEPRTFLSVAEQIAKRYGMVVEFGVLNAGAKDAFETERVDLQQCGRTDLQFLVYEAQSVGAQLVVRNNKFIFTDMGSPGAESQEVAATFQMYGRMDVWKNVYPMNSFKPTSMGTLFLQSHQGVAFFASDPNADPGDEVEGVVSSGDQSDVNAYSSKVTFDAPSKEEGAPTGLKNSDGTPNAAKATVVPDIARMESGRYVPVAMSSDYAREKAKTFLDGARESDAADEGVRVNFSSIALPFVFPGQFVRVSGVGDYFSAVYFLQEQEIRIDEGGAEMTCLAGTRGFPGGNGVLDSFVSNVKKHEEPTDGDPKVVSVEPNPYEGV